MAFFGVPEWIAVDMLTAEAGGDVIEMVDGVRQRPAWWTEGRAERRRDAEWMRHLADQRDARGESFYPTRP